MKALQLKFLLHIVTWHCCSWQHGFLPGLWHPASRMLVQWSETSLKKKRAGQSSGNGSSVWVQATGGQRAVSVCVCVCVCVSVWWGGFCGWSTVRETKRRASSVNCNSTGDGKKKTKKHYYSWVKGRGHPVTMWMNPLHPSLLTVN